MKLPLRRKVGFLARPPTVAGVAALAWKCSRTASTMELMVQSDFFSSLVMLCESVVHVLRLRHFVPWNCCIEELRSLLELLEFEGILAGQRRFHPFNLWNLRETSHESFVFTSSTLGIRRKPRTKASVSHLQLWNLKETSHENFVFISSTVDYC